MTAITGWTAAAFTAVMFTLSFASQTQLAAALLGIAGTLGALAVLGCLSLWVMEVFSRDTGDPFGSRELPEDPDEYTAPLMSAVPGEDTLTTDIRQRRWLFWPHGLTEHKAAKLAAKTARKARIRRAMKTPAAGNPPCGTVAPPPGRPVLSPPQDTAPAGQEGPQEGRARPLTAGASAPVPPGPRHARCRPSPRQRAAAAARGFIRGLAAATWDAYMAFLKARQLPTGLPLEPLPPMTSAPAVKATVAPDGAQAGAEPALSYSTPEGSLRALLSDDTLARGMGAVKS